VDDQIGTLGAFGFATKFAPGNDDESPLEDLCRILHGLAPTDMPSMPRMASVRRLYLEAYTLAMAELKRSIDAPSNEVGLIKRPSPHGFNKYKALIYSVGFKAFTKAPRPLPLLEREERQSNQKKRLAGVDLDGQCEPSHALIDKAASAFAKNQLTRIEWKDCQVRPLLSKALYQGLIPKAPKGHMGLYRPHWAFQDCTSREQELTGIDEVPSWRFDPTTGTFKKGPGGEVLADNTSDLLWKMGMDRRGLAYDQASILSHSVHSKWVSEMITHKHRVPPHRYEVVSWNQLHDSDVEIFKLAGQRARGGIRPDAMGRKPLDDLFLKLMEDNRVTFFLMPLPLLPGAARQDSPADVSQAPAKRPKTGHPTSGGHQQAFNPGPQGQGKGKSGKGKGKSSKGKGGGANRSLPQGLYKKTKSGKAVCPDWNSQGGCSAGTMVQGLEQCPKGLHLCWATNCRKRSFHGFCSHTRADE